MVFTDKQLISFLTDKFNNNAYIISPLIYEWESSNLTPCQFVFSYIHYDDNRFSTILDKVNIVSTLALFNHLFSLQNLSIPTSFKHSDKFIQRLINKFFTSLGDEKITFIRINGFKLLYDCFNYLSINTAYIIPYRSDIEKAVLDELSNMPKYDQLIEFLTILADRHIDIKYLSNNFENNIISHFTDVLAHIQKYQQNDNPFIKVNELLMESRADILKLLRSLSILPVSKNLSDTLHQFILKMEAILAINKMITVDDHISSISQHSSNFIYSNNIAHSVDLNALITEHIQSDYDIKNSFKYIDENYSLFTQ